MVYTRHMRTSVTVLAVSVVVGVATTAAGPAFAEDLAKPTTNIWSTWWLWVLGSLSLLWWAWLGWSARKNPAAQGI